MQIDVWLPRHTLPFAAPSRPALLALPEPAPASAPPRPVVAAARIAAPAVAPVASVPPLPQPPVQHAAALKAVLQASPSSAPSAEGAGASSAAPPASAPGEAAASTPIPRFSLQLLRAGHCLLLVSLPTGEAFASRDPAYILLRDLLRAAGLVDSPQPLGEPIRWPMLRGRVSHFDQGAQAAHRYVQTVLQAQQEAAHTRCIWLIGEAARRFAGAPAVAEGHSALLDDLGRVWVLADLERLMEHPALKAELWQHMRRERHHWIFPDE